MEVTQEMLEYLDELQESGVVNMFGAAPYVQKQFNLTRAEAIEVLTEWMRTYSERHP